MKKKTNHISELTKQLFFFLSFLGGLDVSSMKLNTQDEGEVPTRLNGFDLREFICRCEEDFSRHVKQLVLDTILFSFFFGKRKNWTLPELVWLWWACHFYSHLCIIGVRTSLMCFPWKKTIIIHLFLQAFGPMLEPFKTAESKEREKKNLLMLFHM